MLNRTKEEAVKYIRENHKSFGGTQNNKQVGYELGVSGPRVSQIVSGLRLNADPIPTGQPEVSEVQEAA